MENKHDLTSGSIVRKLTAFALPILAGNLLQAVYSIVDMVIVGQFTGASGMTAVSIGGQVTTIVLMICLGISNGGSAYIGQLFGARQMDESEKVIGSLLSFLAILALVITAALLAACSPLLNALNTPEDSLSATSDYLRVCLCGSVFVYIYNALYASLRGVGISFEPMLFVVITTAENIVLDLLFVAVFHWGAGGAAAATVLSQFTCMLLTVIFVKRKTELFSFSLSSLRIHSDKLKLILRIGLPQSIQFTCTTISFLLLGALINTYGTSAAAAAGAANKIYSFGILPGQSFMSAIVTLTAQNHPGRNYRRIIQGMLFGMAVSMGVAVCFLLLCHLLPDTIYRLFTDDPDVARVGSSYLRIYALSLLDEGVMFCMFGVLTGSGYTTVTMACGITSAFAVRYAAAYVLSTHTALGFNGIAVAYSLAPLVGIAVGACFFATGKWKVSRITT